MPDAEQLLRQVLAREPDQPRALHALGTHLAKTGRLVEALECLQRSVTLDPANAAAHYDLGLALQLLNRPTEAVASYRRALEHDPHNAVAANNLAIALRQSGQLDEAIAAYRRAIEIDPNYAEAHNNLATALKLKGLLADAADGYRRAIQLKPAYVEAHYHLGIALLESGNYALAIPPLERAAALHPQHAHAWKLLAYTLSQLGRASESLVALRRAAELDSADIEIPFLLAALEGRTPPAPPPGYIAAHFDAFAPRFEQRLVAELKYHAPEALHRLITRYLDSPTADLHPPLVILDGGCGTGLAAPLLAPLASRLIGVDVSKVMLEIAGQRHLYHELVAGDLVAELRRRPGSIDLLLAADVFIYVGELTPVFAAAATALRAGGLLAFSVETISEGYALRPTGRYGHALRYLRELAARFGFHELAAEPIDLRIENGHPVAGHILLLQRPRGD